MEQKTGGGIIGAVDDELEGVGLITQIFDGSNLVWSDGNNSNLWMALVGTEFTDLSTSLNSTLVSDGTLLESNITGTGIGLLSVTGAGLADAFFDANSQVAVGTGNVADWEINSSI